MKIRDSLQDLKNNVISVIGGDTRQLFLDEKYDIESTVKNFVKLVFGE